MKKYFHKLFAIFFFLSIGITYTSPLSAMKALKDVIDSEQVRKSATYLDKKFGTPDKDRIMTEKKPSIVKECSYEERLKSRSLLEHGKHYVKENPATSAVKVTSLAIGGLLFLYSAYEFYKWCGF